MIAPRSTAPASNADAIGCVAATTAAPRSTEPLTAAAIEPRSSARLGADRVCPRSSANPVASWSAIGWAGGVRRRARRRRRDDGRGVSRRERVDGAGRQFFGARAENVERLKLEIERHADEVCRQVILEHGAVEARERRSSRVRGRRRSAQASCEAGQTVRIAGDQRRRLVGDQLAVDERERRAGHRRGLARSRQRPRAFGEIDRQRVDRVPAGDRRQARCQEALPKRRGQNADLRIGRTVHGDPDVGAAHCVDVPSARPDAPNQTCATPPVSPGGGSKISGVLTGTAGTPVFG